MASRRFGVLGVLVAAGGLLGVAGPVAPCDPAGTDFCALPRAEDVVFLPGGSWFAVSSAAPDAPLQFIDAATRRRRPLVLPFRLGDAPRARTAPGRRAGSWGGAADCPGPPAQWRAGGNDVKRHGRVLRLVVLNRAETGATVRDGDERIELFDLSPDAAGPQARWVGCVPVPARWSLNDVALAPDGTLYASHQFDRPRSPGEAAATRQRWLSGSATGQVVEWTHRGGWRAVPGTALSFNNGVAVSPDGRTLAAAGTYSSAVLLLERRSGRVRRVALPHTPDNVTALEDGRFLSTGHTGVPVTGVDACRDPGAVPCGFPFAVAEVGGDGSVRVVFEHDGARIPGASVAAPHGGRLYLGSFFGDRVTVVEPAAVIVP
ncbi:MAG: hypothetical protein MUF07_18390 [Steroidobacteraceae bacterium]|jgi:hypothetical protein|nr:hypothetical protein [Steroidobacteraceae bacterium]